MEEDLHNFEDLKQENVELKEIIDGQNARIHDYETEIEETKSQMARLENLVQKVQEQTIKDKIMSTPAVCILNFRLFLQDSKVIWDDVFNICCWF